MLFSDEEKLRTLDETGELRKELKEFWVLQDEVPAGPPAGSGPIQVVRDPSAGERLEVCKVVECVLEERREVLLTPGVMLHHVGQVLDFADRWVR